MQDPASFPAFRFFLPSLTLLNVRPQNICCPWPIRNNAASEAPFKLSPIQASSIHPLQSLLAVQDLQNGFRPLSCDVQILPQHLAFKLGTSTAPSRIFHVSRSRFRAPNRPRCRGMPGIFRAISRDAVSEVRQFFGYR
jgi:hypothetical protein